jgi:hypothetical protein
MHAVSSGSSAAVVVVVVVVFVGSDDDDDKDDDAELATADKDEADDDEEAASSMLARTCSVSHCRYVSHNFTSSAHASSSATDADGDDGIKSPATTGGGAVESWRRRCVCTNKTASALYKGTTGHSGLAASGDAGAAVSIVSVDTAAAAAVVVAAVVVVVVFVFTGVCFCGISVVCVHSCNEFAYSLFVATNDVSSL